MRSLLLTILSAAIGCLFIETVSIAPAYAQIKEEKDIDGKIGDWFRDPDHPKYLYGTSDREGDVPISGIDIVLVDWDEPYGDGLHKGESFPEGKYFYFLVQTKGDLFAYAKDTSVEILWDTDTTQDWSGTDEDPLEGQKQDWIDFERGVIPLGTPRSHWETFYPDRRFRIVGKEGKISGEQFQYWDGSKWVGEEVGDAPEIESAFLGKNLEIGLIWESIGDPRPGKEEVVFLKYAVGIFQGDYYDLTIVDWLAIPGLSPEATESATFGRIKSLYR